MAEVPNDQKPKHDELSLVVVQTTLADKEAARTLAITALKTGIAACAHISSPIESLYHWNGALETASEVVVQLKTTHATLQRAIEFITEHHPYDVPELIWFPVDASDAYKKWAGHGVHHA
jgi:periplasmic divalent cation tolerance protein